MGIVMICLMNLSFTGIKLHEILGILVFFLFLFHKMLNFKWIKSITMNLFKKEIKGKTKIMYVIDIILLILVILNVVTGILISTHILTNITTNNIEITSNWHHFFAYWLMIVLIIHIGLHWEFIRNAMKIKKDSSTEKVILCIITAIIAFILLKSNIIKKLMIPRKEMNLQYEIENTKSTINNTSKKDDESEGDKNNQNSSSVVTEQPTIEEYLSKLFCTGCGRHCPLTNPACSRGMSKQTQKVQEYNQTYGTNETYINKKK